MYKVFLDTNIIIDYIKDNRGKCSINADLIFDQCVRGEIECYIAPHTISNLFFILRKDFTSDVRKQIIATLCKLCKIQPLDGMMIEQALKDKRFDDLEDALQMVCAEKCGADIFVTRDAKGFRKSKMKVTNHYLSEDIGSIFMPSEYTTVELPRGALHDYVNPELAEREGDAWEMAVTDRYENNN